MKLENAIQSNKFKSEVQKAGLNILYTAWWLKTLSCKELKEFGLTHEQYNVLRILKGKHPNQMCVKDIAGRMIEKNSNVPRIIDRLVVKKLVKRTQGEHDGRQTVMALTQAGLSVLESSTNKIDEIYEATVSLNNKDAAALNNLLEKIREKEK
ncbi:MAG: MarR family transcriptional regulator [Bacteroidetes bacterium]|nr:MarR family transcriptional regulator [Bacteroidota bacterium]MBS1592582.1 MarR family transcriptional regulator [Bacteroidota bacterium]MBS1639930.1 MarR family transcriptional regulator [Bacteroidota bacterium]MBS1640869.1 MarR family transcriptional regulator [Bacteroidota bacterium]MBS1669999.1 MarR family transcriptional regulator [Bacteroidota bacterium]